jgi:hypothetical protein
MKKSSRATHLYLCIFGPYDGQWRSIDEGLQAGYKQFNRAYSWGEPRKLSAILVHNESLQVRSGLKW